MIATYPPLEHSTECDVAIIGGGITGACVAHELALAGHAVVVLDRRDIGAGSTAGSTGLLMYELDTSLRELAARIGEREAVRCYRVVAEGLERIGHWEEVLPVACGFRRREALYGASTARDAAELKAEYELRARHGFAVQYWDRARVQASSTLPFKAAIVSAPAAEVDPHALTHGLLKLAVQRGARVFDRTTVHRYRATRHGVALHTDRGVQVRARRVVIASGYEAMTFMSLPGVRLRSTYAFISEPLADFPGWPDWRLIWETARPYGYARITADRRIVFGGADEPFNRPTVRDGMLPRKVRLLLRRFRQWFPQIRIEPAYAWAGTFAETKDGLPYIGPHRSFPRAFFALGYGGNGITFAAVAARLMRDFCAGRPNADAALFRLER